MPGLLSTDHKQFRADYNFQINESSPKHLVLTAQLKSGSHSGRTLHDRLDYAFSDGKPLPYAVRFWSGSRTTVYQLHDPLINKPAPDAETFLKPDVSGLKRIDLREPPAKSK